MSSFTRIYSPSTVRKNRRSSNVSISYSPSNSRSNSYSYSNKYAPSTAYANYRILKRYVDDSPSTSLSYSDDYAPTFYRSNVVKEKYAPSSGIEYYLRYAPSNDETLDYDPILISRFKPQILVTSNYGSLRDYYAYLINLLSVLR